MQEAKPRPDKYSQVCVWPGVILHPSDYEEFEETMLEEVGVRIKILEVIETRPDMDRGKPVPGTGGRHDLFFCVHEADIREFALKRLIYNIRWVEDMISKVNGGNRLYPEYVEDYVSWDPNDEEEQ